MLFERLLPARYWPTYLRYRQYTMPIIMGLVMLNFLLNPHGPIDLAVRSCRQLVGVAPPRAASANRGGRHQPHGVGRPLVDR